MTCPHCESDDLVEVGAINGACQFRCKCGHVFWDDGVDPDE